MQSMLESLKRQREQILPDPSEEMLARHTSLLEIAIISLYNRLANRLDAEAESFQIRSGGAVFALGSLGRGLVGPYETVRLLFLTSQAVPWEEGWLDEISQPLVEAGWKTEAEQATLDDEVRQAETDSVLFFDLLQARYISGNRHLAEELESALSSISDGRRDEVLQEIYEKSRARDLRLREASNWLEPNLLSNPGGLKDIVAIRNACRVASDTCNLEDAIFQGYLLRAEVDALRQAEKKLVQMLNLLYKISRNEEGRLGFKEQEILAEKLAYPERSGFLPVEALMQEVHQLFHSVVFVAREFWERLQESRWEWQQIEKAPEVELEPGVHLQSGKISIQTAQYEPSASNLVHIFVLAARHQAGFDNNTRRWVQHHRNLLATAPHDPRVKEEVVELMKGDDPELPVMRRFYDFGFLTALAPELAAVHGLTQHDSFHAYPVHENHLRTLAELKKLFRGDYSREEPELTRIAQRIQDPSSLFWAAVLHNIGKAAGQDHALHGGEMIPAIAKRLGLAPEESDMVQFLVAHHPLLRDSASMRYLGDQEMLSRCMLVVNTPERLELLLLLSFADARATGPKALDLWAQTPVYPLFEKIRHLLEKGEPTAEAIAERMAPLKERVWKKVSRFMEREELETHFTQFSPRYLLTVSPGNIASHLKLEKEFVDSREPFAWKAGTAGSSAILTLICRETSGLLAQITGILALHDFNIVEAQVFTKQNDILLLTFQCNLPEDCEEDWSAVMADLKKLLRGKLALEYRLARHARSRPKREPPKSFPCRISLDNDSSEAYSILEIYAADRVGLLYTITRTLLDLQLRIHVAKITTKGDQGANVLYLRSQEGEKITDTEQIEEIKNALCFWVDEN